MATDDREDERLPPWQTPAMFLTAMVLIVGFGIGVTGRTSIPAPLRVVAVVVLLALEVALGTYAVKWVQRKLL